MGRFEEHARRLAAALEERDGWPSGAPWIRSAVQALPRHRFAPDRLWRWDGRAYAPVDRGADGEAWAATVYAGLYEASVTQVTGGRATSSLSCLSVVVDMLDALRPEPGHRVLELGTGTGWNAALLARRAGPGRVVSVEVDAGLAAAARARLDEAGAGVAVEVGDGAAGWAPRAPFDRVVGTYAVDEVPWAWVEQTRPGGRIVTPWGYLGHVALTVAADGLSASGRVRGLAQFMPARGTDPGRGYEEIHDAFPPEDERPARWALGPLRDDPNMRFMVRVALPDVRVVTHEDEHGMNVWLHDGVSSWAAVCAREDGRTLAYQGGPRRLADELERALDWWLAEGEPEPRAFGLTVEADGQFVWCRDPVRGPRPPALGMAPSG